MTDNVWFMIASALCVASIVCSVLAVIGCVKTRRSLSQARHNLDSAELARQGYDELEITTEKPQKGEISYPKYREYGDLS